MFLRERQRPFGMIALSRECSLRWEAACSACQRGAGCFSLSGRRSIPAMWTEGQMVLMVGPSRLCKARVGQGCMGCVRQSCTACASARVTKGTSAGVARGASSGGWYVAHLPGGAARHVRRGPHGGPAPSSFLGLERARFGTQAGVGDQMGHQIRKCADNLGGVRVYGASGIQNPQVNTASIFCIVRWPPNYPRICVFEPVWAAVEWLPSVRGRAVCRRKGGWLAARPPLRRHTASLPPGRSSVPAIYLSRPVVPSPE